MYIILISSAFAICCNIALFIAFDWLCKKVYSLKREVHNLEFDKVTNFNNFTSMSNQARLEREELRRDVQKVYSELEKEREERKEIREDIRSFQKIKSNSSLMFEPVFVESLKKFQDDYVLKIAKLSDAVDMKIDSTFKHLLLRHEEETLMMKTQFEEAKRLLALFKKNAVRELSEKQPSRDK